MDRVFLNRIKHYCGTTDPVELANRVSSPQKIKHFFNHLIKNLNDDRDFLFETLDTVSEKLTGKEIAKYIYSAIEEDNAWVFKDWPIQRLNKFHDSPYTKEIMMEYASSHHIDIINKAEELQAYPWFLDVISEALSSSSPELVADFVDNKLASLAPKFHKPIQELAESKYDSSNQIMQYFMLESQTNSRSESLRSDPSLNKLSLVSTSNRSDSLNQNFRQDARVARNLYFAGKEVNKQNVASEEEKIANLRMKLAPLALFKDRKVVVLANDELDKDKQALFGKDQLIEKLNIESGDSLLLKPGNASFDLVKSLSQSEKPLSFIFDGHGNSDFISVSESTLIHRDKFTELIKERQKQGHYDDIYIFASCSSQTFLRNIYESLKDTNEPLPTMIGISEYGQLGFSSKDGIYGNDFFDKLLSKEDDKPTKFSNLINIGHTKNSQPCLYVNDPDLNVPVQIL